MKTSIELALSKGMSIEAINKAIASTNKKYPNFMVMVPKAEWTESMNNMENAPTVVWRSREFLAQVHNQDHEDIFARISVCRSTLEEWAMGG